MLLVRNGLQRKPDIQRTKKVGQCAQRQILVAAQDLRDIRL